MSDFLRDLFEKVRRGSLSKEQALKLLEASASSRHLQGAVTLCHRRSLQELSGPESVCFASALNARESFLTAHRIQGKPVLPAVAYLEILRFAGQVSAP